MVAREKIQRKGRSSDRRCLDPDHYKAANRGWQGPWRRLAVAAMLGLGAFTA